MCFNAHRYPVEFLTPDGIYAQRWTAVLDTVDPVGTGGQVVTAGTSVTVAPHSLLVLQKTA